MQDINQTIQALATLHSRGKNPQELMQMFVQRNGQGQLTQLQSQIQNMAQGMTPKQFILQIAKQNGANEQSIQALSRMLGGN